MSIVWRVGEKPTGPYRSFQNRFWPSAQYRGHPIAALYCEIEPSYSPRVAEAHELIVRVADWRKSPWECWEWRTLKARPVGVKAAKELVSRFYKEHPEWLPQ